MFLKQTHNCNPFWCISSKLTVTKYITSSEYILLLILEKKGQVGLISSSFQTFRFGSYILEYPYQTHQISNPKLFPILEILLTKCVYSCVLFLIGWLLCNWRFVSNTPLRSCWKRASTLLETSSWSLLCYPLIVHWIIVHTLNCNNLGKWFPVVQLIFSWSHFTMSLLQSLLFVWRSNRFSSSKKNLIR